MTWVRSANAGWGPGIPSFCGWHSPTLPQPHLRKASHSYGHLDPGQPGAEAAPLAPRAQGPVVLGHRRQGTARGGVASQHLLQLTQSAAFCPRDSRGSLAWDPTNPPPKVLGSPIGRNPIQNGGPAQRPQPTAATGTQTSTLTLRSRPPQRSPPGLRYKSLRSCTAGEMETCDKASHPQQGTGPERGPCTKVDRDRPLCA